MGMYAYKDGVVRVALANIYNVKYSFQYLQLHVEMLETSDLARHNSTRGLSEVSG